MVSRSSLTLIVAGCVVCSALAWGQQTSTVAAGSISLKLSRQDGQPSVGGLRVIEGPERKAVNLGPARDWSETRARLQFTRTEADGTLSETVVIRGGEALFIDLSFRNGGAQRRLLDVEFALPFVGANSKWWDGRYESKPHPARRDPMEMGLRLPLSVAWTTGRGMALGIDPHRLLSVFGTGAEATADGVLLTFGTRLVLDPGQEVTLPLCAYDFVPNFEHLDAVQRWYELYPDLFAMNPGVRPSLIGGGGYLSSRQTTRELQWEEARRFGFGWEWAYCPAQTPGDWYADERFYDPNKGYAGKTDAHRNVEKGSLEQYRSDMRERFQRGWWATNNAYYMLPHAADEMVLAKYPDGVIIDSAGSPDKAMVGWIKPDSTTHMTYPWGNSYGQEVVREIGQIAADFGPAAVGFDEAYGSAPQYGAGIDGEPARAWDDKGGVYGSTQVALAHLGETIHSNKVRGYTMATIFNKPQSYNTATRADVGMHEHPPYENSDAVIPQRLLLGHKPFSWWSPLKTWDILRREGLSPETLREAMNGMYSFVRLSSLRYGAFPMSHQVWGNRQIVEIMPVMSELLTEGWQATPGMHANEDLWLSRYGSEARSFLVAGNPKREARSGAVTVLGGYLGAGQFLFCDYEGRPLRSTSAGTDTRLDLGQLGMHEHRIARAVVQLQPQASVSVTGSGTMGVRPLSEGKTGASWMLDRDTVGKLVVRLPRGARAVQLTINGKPRPFVAEEGAVRAEGTLPAQGALVLTWQPPVLVKATREQLLAFPFEKGGQASAQIVLPAKAGEHDQYLGKFLSAYFDYWYRRQSKPAGGVADLADVPPTCVLPVVSAPVGDKSRVVFAQADRPNVSLAAGPTLVVGGATPDQRELALRRLMEILDEKYPYVGVYADSDLYRRAGLVGKPLE